MNKAMRNEAVVLLKSFDGDWVKDQSPHESTILPSDETDDDGDNDDGGGMIHVGLLFLMDKLAGFGIREY